jgi:hypothetical protein
MTAPPLGLSRPASREDTTAALSIRELENANFDSFATARTILELSQRAAEL